MEEKSPPQLTKGAGPTSGNADHNRRALTASGELSHANRPRSVVRQDNCPVKTVGDGGQNRGFVVRLGPGHVF